MNVVNVIVTLVRFAGSVVLCNHYLPRFIVRYSDDSSSLSGRGHVLHRKASRP